MSTFHNSALLSESDEGFFNGCVSFFSNETPDLVGRDDSGERCFAVPDTGTEDGGTDVV